MTAERRTTTRRWAKVWGVVCNPGELAPGDPVVMENAAGHRQAAHVTAVVPYMTKAGKLRAFAHITLELCEGVTAQLHDAAPE